MTDNIKYKINSLNENFDHFNKDVEKFIEKGNKSASTRARKALLEIGKLTKELRKLIVEIKKENK